jgi:hypothetical protein
MRNKTAAVITLGAVLILAALYTGAGRLSGFGSGFRRGDGCELVKGPAEDGVTPVLAECKWPVPVERLHTLIRNWGEHYRYFGNLAESTVLGASDDVVLVRHVHRASGISDREVIVEWTTEKIPDGYRYHWRKSPDQSAATGTRVEVEVCSGYWEVTRDGSGSRVGYEVRYLPGGSVPSFLVQMFQSSGMRGVLADLRKAAASETILVQRHD